MDVFDWIIPLLAFIAGFVISTVYRKLAFEGISVRQCNSFVPLSKLTRTRTQGDVFFGSGMESPSSQDLLRVDGVSAASITE